MIFAVIFAGALFYSSLCDIRERRIPNSACLVILGLGLMDSAPDCLLGAVCVSVPMLFLSVMTGGSFGGGDIKLMAAGGFFLGPAGILQAFVIGMSAAGVYCIWLLVGKRKGRKSEIALGPFLCLGMLAAMV